MTRGQGACNKKKGEGGGHCTRTSFIHGDAGFLVPALHHAPRGPSAVLGGITYGAAWCGCQTGAPAQSVDASEKGLEPLLD